MRKQRKTYTPEEKVGIIRKHLLDGTAVSDLCDEYGLHPTVYYRWQKEFFEGGAAAFAKESDRQIGELKRRVAEAQAQLSRKNEVLAEVMEEYVRCKKTLGPAEWTMGGCRAAGRGGGLRGHLVGARRIACQAPAPVDGPHGREVPRLEGAP